MFKKIIHWILVSSSNPNETSTTIKGFLLALVAYLVPVFALLHIPVDSTTITTVIVSGVAVLQALLVLIGASVGFVGLLNKVVRTITGRNQALNALPPLPPAQPLIISQPVV